MSVLEHTGTGRSASGYDHRFAVWAAAQAEANLAFDGWRAAPGSQAYAAFRAAEDRADAAQDALSAFSG